MGANFVQGYFGFGRTSRRDLSSPSRDRCMAFVVKVQGPNPEPLFLGKSPILRTIISSVAQMCSTLCHPMDCSTPGFPVHHQLLEVAQTHVH